MRKKSNSTDEIVQMRFNNFLGYAYATEDEVKKNPKILEKQQDRITAAVKKLNSRGEGLDNLKNIKEFRNADYASYYPDLEDIKFKRRKLYQAILEDSMMCPPTLVITNLDRIASSPEQALHIFELLGINCVIILDMELPGEGWGSTTALNLLRATVSFVKTTANEAKLEGRARKRRKNPDYCDGRRRTPDNQQRIDRAFELMEHGSTYAEAAEICEISVSTLTREQRRRKQLKLSSENLEFRSEA